MYAKVKSVVLTVCCGVAALGTMYIHIVNNIVEQKRIGTVDSGVGTCFGLWGLGCLAAESVRPIVTVNILVRKYWMWGVKGKGLHPLAPLFRHIGIGTHMLHDALHTQVPCLGVKLTHHIYVRTNVYGVWLITSCSTHKDTHVLKSEQSPSMYICQRDC